jgi:hypothetical protein
MQTFLKPFKKLAGRVLLGLKQGVVKHPVVFYYALV